VPGQAISKAPNAIDSRLLKMSYQSLSTTFHFGPQRRAAARRLR
jgi:hypothetical protein